jgi:hypothetical protein
MGARIRIMVLALITGAAFVGGVWAQNNATLEVFGGTITKVDWSNKEFVVENGDGGMIFQWNDQTQMNGPPAQKAGSDFEILKEGMKVTVTYKAGRPKRIATRIDVEAGKVKALKGLSFPFDCGVSVC